MKYAILLGVVLSAGPAFAQTDTALLRQIARQISEVQTLQSDFTEEKHLSILSQPLESAGHFSFDKPAQKLHWQYRVPFQNGFLMEGDQLYRVQDHTHTPIKDTLGKMMVQHMLVWLTLDFEALQRDYHITLHAHELSFVPRAKGHKLVKQIVVWLDEKNPQLVKQVKLEQPNGDFILWKFSNIRLNQPLAAGGV